MNAMPSGTSVFLVIRDDLLGENYGPVSGVFSSRLAAELWIAHRVLCAKERDKAFPHLAPLNVRSDSYRIDEMEVDPPLR